jgi:RHS repeat-associated protein
LDYFLARYYSSGHGRFTSPDEFTGGPDELFDFSDAASSNPTFYADLTDPQSLNKYKYCYNNPLLYIDPDGHQEGFKKWVRDTLRGAAAAFNEDNSLPAAKGDQTTTGRVIGHGAAILQGVTEVVTGGNLIVGGGAEAVVTSPAAGTGVGAVIPAAGVATAVVGAGLVVHGGAVLLNTGGNIFSKSSSSHGNSATSTKPQHGYEIVDQAGDVKKVGVSGQPLNQSGTSPRATPQVNRANKTRTGANQVKAVIRKQNVKSRKEILTWERKQAEQRRQEGNSMDMHKRP